MIEIIYEKKHTHIILKAKRSRSGVIIVAARYVKYVLYFIETLYKIHILDIYRGICDGENLYL